MIGNGSDFMEVIVNCFSSSRAVIRDKNFIRFMRELAVIIVNIVFIADFAVVTIVIKQSSI